MRLLVLVLASLLVACHPKVRMADPATQPRNDREGWALERALHYARLAGVEVWPEMTDRTFPAGATVAAAYVGCPVKDRPPKVYVWRGCASDERVCPDSYLDAVLAHEVCHIYYHEYESPCRVDEGRATECGARLQAGEKP